MFVVGLRDIARSPSHLLPQGGREVLHPHAPDLSSSKKSFSSKNEKKSGGSRQFQRLSAKRRRMNEWTNEGRTEGRKDGGKEGRTEGRKDGREEGREEGRERGRERTRKELTENQEEKKNRLHMISRRYSGGRGGTNEKQKVSAAENKNNATHQKENTPKDTMTLAAPFCLRRSMVLKTTAM